MDSQVPVYGCHALLIGINAYTTKPLKGCVNDVNAIEEYLDTLIFPVQTQKLIAHDSTAATAKSTADNTALRPTLKNVRTAIDQLKSSTRAGDYVYIHFAGHGTRVEPSDRFSNQGTGDLALVMVGENAGSEDQYLSGAELARSVKEMTDNGAVVTLILDCCFSAAVYRKDDPDTRFMSWGSRTADTGAKARTVERGFNASMRLPSYRDVSTLPNWLVHPDKFTVIVACGPGQEAKELEIKGGQRHGVLSYFLLEAWRKHGGIRRKHRVIHRQLCSETRRCGCQQDPVIYGNEDQGLFGSVGLGNEDIFIEVAKQPEGTDLMQAGQVHGIQVDDEFTVVSRSSTRSHSGLETVPLAARVIAVRGLTSDVEIIGFTRISDRTLWATDFQVTASFRAHWIKVAPNLAHGDELVRTLRARAFDAGVHSNERQPLFCVDLDDEERYRILDSSNGAVPNIPELCQDRTGVDSICDIIEHLTKYGMVKDLANEASREFFGPLFDACIECPRGWARAGKVTEAKDGELLELSIQNLADFNLYVFVYNISLSWQVENLLRGTYETIPPRDDRIGLKGFFKKRLKLSVPEDSVDQGYGGCNDMIKVIITLKPTSLDLLELPKIGQKARHKGVSRAGSEIGDSTSEEWFALNFPIRTSI